VDDGEGGGAGELEEQQQRNESSKSAELEGITRRQYLLLLFFVFVVAWDYFGVVLGICVYELFLRRLEPSGFASFYLPARSAREHVVATTFSGSFAHVRWRRSRSFVDSHRLLLFSLHQRKTNGRTDGRTNSFKTTNSERRTDGRIHSKRRTASDGRTDEFIQNDERRPTNGRMASFAEFRPFGHLFAD